MSQERSQLFHGISWCCILDPDRMFLPSDGKEFEIARGQVEPPFPCAPVFVLLQCHRCPILVPSRIAFVFPLHICQCECWGRVACRSCFKSKQLEVRRYQRRRSASQGMKRLWCCANFEYCIEEADIYIPSFKSHPRSTSPHQVAAITVQAGILTAFRTSFPFEKSCRHRQRGQH